MKNAGLQIGDFACGPTFFTCVGTRSGRLVFIYEKLIFGKVRVVTYFIFYFKGKIKQERKTLKVTPSFLEKACL